MTPFQAWHLPPGFSLLGEEVAVLDRSDLPSIRYPALPEPRLLELLDLLRRERETMLATIPLSRMVEAVDRVAGRLLDPGDSIRITALPLLSSFSGFSSPMAEAVLDGMARGWLRESLWELVRSEFPDPGVLDGFRPGRSGGSTRALGFPLTFHLGAGSVPGVATTSLIRGLLVKSAVLLKPGFGDIPLPLVFARGLEEEDPELARKVAVLYWPVEESGRTETVLKEADLVVTYGNDETIRWVRDRLPPQTPLRAYRHRMGFGLVGRGALGGSVRSVVQDAARSVALFDQKGCVSPHVFFVERGGEVEPGEWAALLAGALQELETVLPSGDVSLEEGVAIQQLRGVAELEEGLGEVVVHHGGDRAPWTVLFLPGGTIEPSCLNRTVRVVPVDTVQEALSALGSWVPYLQTVGVTGLEGRASEVMESLARLGVTRIASLGEVPWPRPWWHHDGFGPLQDLVRWTDVEGVDSFSSGTVEE
ncbi:MAG: acyl-CoA reductase [Gemmatimonadota bacterium]